jgi:hypothetical protein
MSYTAEKFLAALESMAHDMRPIADGDGWYRGRCSCGWMSLPQMTWNEAEAVPCDVETAQRDGAARVRMWNERRGRA